MLDTQSYKHSEYVNTAFPLQQWLQEGASMFALFVHRLFCYYEAYSESKYSFVVKKSSKVSYKILLLSDSTFFKLFFHIFAAIIEALIVAGHKFLYTLLIECGRLRC